MGDIARFNGLLGSQFRRCRLLTSIEDYGRKRIIRVYAIPGDKSIVGMCDGVDSWIGSSTTSFKGVDLNNVTGEQLVRPKPAKPRHKLLGEEMQHGEEMPA